MKKVLIFSLVMVTALALSLGAFLLPMASAVKADLGALQTWLTNNGYDIDVYTDELGIEMFTPGVYRVVCVDGEHGYVNPTGWYTTEENCYDLFGPEIFDGEAAWVDSAVEFGFYIDTGYNPPYIRLFTQNALNGDGFDHALVFHNKRVGEEYSTGYIVAFEDLWGGGDADYEDRIIELWQDTDQDGIPDVEDNCPTVANPGQEDGDSDGVGDACDGCPADPDKIDPGVCGCGVADTDSDGDGTADCIDGCPNDPDKTDPGACGCGVADTDSDGDGVLDCNDNCPGVANPNQEDGDADGIGDACDNCPAVYNPGQEDSNGNGIGDACEAAPPTPTPTPPTPTPTSTPPSVGGTIIPTDKSGVVTPWILASALIVVAGVSLALWNRKRGAERP